MAYRLKVKTFKAGSDNQLSVMQNNHGNKFDAPWIPARLATAANGAITGTSPYQVKDFNGNVQSLQKIGFDGLVSGAIESRIDLSEIEFPKGNYYLSTMGYNCLWDNTGATQQYHFYYYEKI
ncbi:MAG: hypothetical protein EOP56_13590 [Sphingobacteriales bacterium]|nr:MAG: hypothetical protein EOP56_13590 [Sphingobacteriales bacterium]